MSSNKKHSQPSGDSTSDNEQTDVNNEGSIESNSEPVIIPRQTVGQLSLVSPQGFSSSDLFLRRSVRITGSIQRRIERLCRTTETTAATLENSEKQIAENRKEQEEEQQSNEEPDSSTGVDPQFRHVIIDIVDPPVSIPSSVAPSAQPRSTLRRDPSQPMITSSEDTSNSEDERQRRQESGVEPRPAIVHRRRFALDEILNSSDSTDSTADNDHDID